MNTWFVYLVILFIGAAQGIVLGITLWKSNKPLKHANRFLSVILVFFSYRLIVEALKNQGIAGVDSNLYYVLLEYNWVYGCLIYFFIRSYLHPNFRLQKKDWIHFLPVGIEFLFSSFIKLQNIYWDGTRESLSWAGYYGYTLWVHTPFQLIISFGLVIWYVLKSSKIYEAYKIKLSLNNLSYTSLKWLNTILIVYLYFSILVLLITSIDFLFFNYAFNPFFRYPTYIGMAIITYWLGLQGFSRRHDELPKQITPISTQQKTSWDAILDKADHLMATQHLYKKPKLSLNDFAEILEIPAVQLTQSLNRIRKKNFTDYINEFRVEEVKRMMADPSFQHYTLLAIAYEAGFNSKASFNRIVKKISGKSPSELRKSMVSEI